jgi:hypothetical protein
MSVHPFATLRGFAFAGAALTLTPMGCANNPAAGGPGTYRGVLVGATEIGTMEVTVAEASSGPLPASGTMDLAGTAVSLSGALDRSQASLSLSSTAGHQLAGVSRTEYALGTYQGPQESGSFALLLEADSGSPVRLFCGSLVLTSSTGTGPIPFGVAATPSGSAFCVAPGFVWFGELDASGALSCENRGGVFFGDVNAEDGNQWGTGSNYGTWTVAPCGGGAPDGGADGGPNSSPDAGAGEDVPA